MRQPPPIGTSHARISDIVQEGPDPNGGTARWTFSEIEPDSFHWTAEQRLDGGDWRLLVDIRARRVRG